MSTKRGNAGRHGLSQSLLALSVGERHWRRGDATAMMLGMPRTRADGRVPSCPVAHRELLPLAWVPVAG